MICGSSRRSFEYPGSRNPLPSSVSKYSVATNLQGNKRNQFHPMLTGLHARCVAQARTLPVLLDRAPSMS
jgi:hypothetical protein